MDERLGALGNVEIYVILKYYNEEVINSLMNIVPFKLLVIYVNNWKEGKSKEVDFDPSIFTHNVHADEEIVFRFQLGDNYFSITLLEDRCVVCIYFRAWYFLEHQLIIVVEHLLTNCEIVLFGFELDFKYDDSDVQSALLELKSDGTNYPFILKEVSENKIEIFSDDRTIENSNLLELLKMKVSPVFEMIS
ncbi:hypothetical protein [uncultured Mucilaginibacter sp.]|uniref:hypothetical protein n=1 Tax=uncultured Mucilaginibacter sp. TaxID=797541 RepID=UPI0025F1FF11|nr:hypothetical protein [uncultured Mucilaginibacter sp.]